MSLPNMMTDCISHLNGSVYNGTLNNNSKLYDDLIVRIPSLTKNETFLHILFISQAIPINCFIGLMFILNKQLQQTPRNAFWIGIVAINLLTILIAALRLALTYIGDDQDDGIVCFLFSLLTGKPYTLLLFIQFLATLDRYYSSSEFYKKHVTTRFIIFVQIYAFIFIFIVTSLPQLSGDVAFRCGFSLKMAEYNIFLRSFIFFLCVFQFFKFDCKTRCNLRNKQKANLDIKKKEAQIYKNDVSIIINLTNLPSKYDNNKTNEEITFKINISTDNYTENGDEEDKDVADANNAMLFSDYIKLLVVTYPMLVFFISGSYNKNMCEDSSEITTTVPSMGLSYFLYAVYGPIIFCYSSKDFCKALDWMFTLKVADAALNKPKEEEVGLTYVNDAAAAPKKKKKQICIRYSSFV